MDFDKLLSVLLHSKHMDESLKRHKISDAISERDNHGHTSVEHLVWKNNLQAIKDFFYLVIRHAPTSLPRLLQTTSKEGWNIGHVIARYQDQETLEYFFDIVNKYAHGVLPNLLRAKSKSHWNIAHIIARAQDLQTLEYFFGMVIEQAPETLISLLRARVNDGRHLGHIIAQYQSPDALAYYLNLVKIYAPGSMSRLLTSPLKDGLTMGHYIAHYQNHEALGDYFKFVDSNIPNDISGVLKNITKEGWHIGHLIAGKQNQEQALAVYLDFVVNKSPQDFEELVTMRTVKGWQLGHFIATFQSQQCMADFIQRVITLAPRALPDIINAKSHGMDMIDIIEKQHPSSLRPLIYQLLTCNVPLGEALNERLTKYKSLMVEHISRLPVEEQVVALKNAFDKATPLGRYFDLPTDFWHRTFGENAGLIFRLHALQKKVDTLYASTHVAPAASDSSPSLLVPSIQAWSQFSLFHKPAPLYYPQTDEQTNQFGNG